MISGLNLRGPLRVCPDEEHLFMKTLRAEVIHVFHRIELQLLLNDKL